MNRRFAALALSGALSLVLLSGCAKPQEVEPTPTPTPTTSVAPVEPPTPTQTPEVTPSELPADPSEGVTVSPEPAAPSESPDATEVIKPAEKPSASPSPAPSSKPSETPAPTPGESAKPEASKVQSIWADLSSQERPELMDLDDALLSDLYGIEGGDLVEYVGKMPLMSAHVTEFLIAQCAPGKAETVKAACEKRLEDLKAGGLYPSSLELVDNYKLVVNGDYVLFAIDEYAEDMVKTFDSYTK